MSTLSVMAGFASHECHRLLDGTQHAHLDSDWPSADSFRLLITRPRFWGSTGQDPDRGGV